MKNTGKTGQNGIVKNILCGAATGAANGLFGGGGGMIAVPLLRALGSGEKEAHATAIAVILPVSLLSFILYAVRGYFDFSVALPTALGGFFGGFLGAKMLSFLPEKAVFFTFTALQLFAGFWMLFS
ncbi:MAG: TSUP family transporter [Candidatus Scatosoma sp.]